MDPARSAAFAFEFTTLADTDLRGLTTNYLFTLAFLVRHTTPQAQCQRLAAFAWWPRPARSRAGRPWLALGRETGDQVGTGGVVAANQVVLSRFLP